MQAGAGVAGSVVVDGTRIDLIERGAGRPLLLLHAENGIEPAMAAVDALALSAHVIAPTHPGFGRSELAPGMRSVDDLSYFYLDVLDQLDLHDTVVVGVSLGAWIAAEIAVKSTARISRLVMANAVGVKVGDRETRDIADIFALTDQEYLDLVYADPLTGRRDYKALADAEVLAAARAREATARFAWNPYFHNPRLKSRLHRIRIPTLFLWGNRDRMLSEAYGRAYCAMIPGADFELIDRAGHFPHQEQPKVFAERVLAFAGNK
ncbi:MAG TPA: alpha/beta hydrolase [Xanthobacteraceae bacterium]|nr:alpha/beta hydrolase [Xanthobacteraceae bacterium]